MAALTINEGANVNETGISERFCCDHGHKCLKILRANVACQTDSNESDFDFKMAEQFESQGQECATANVSYDQQTVAQDLCHSKDEDGSKPEGVLRLMIHNFRNMNDTVRGPAKLVSGVPWKIMVMPRQHVVAKKGTQKCLGFFLQCCPESYSDSWSCQAAAELRLISQKHGVPNFVRKTNHIYTAKENDWGYSCFMTWADILDESQGYMKEESVILEVFVKAESPKGILTYEAFCKKIQDYMRLSDMQCSRNLIDKALEVNQTALKFCKDKDEVMKEELEKQKTRLIERKLMQSIERIEKDSKVPDNVEGGTNLSNLRQALAGNLAAYKNAASKALTSNNGSTAVNTITEQQMKETLPVENDVNSRSKKQGSKASSENSPNSLLADDDKRGKSSSKSSSDSSSRSEVRTIVDNLVSNLTNEQKGSVLSQNVLRDKVPSLHGGVNEQPLNSQFPLRRRSTGGNGALELFDLDEPCCSDQSDEDEEDEDESDYEDMDEVCDGCLVERLDNMSGAAVAPVEAQDMSCQTDVQFLSQQLPIQQQQLKVRTSGGPGVVAPPTSPQPTLKKSDLIAKLSPPTLKNLKQKLLAEQQACAANKTSITLGADTNEELLKLITAKDNKASLSTIKDTLERLLSHDSLDALGGVGNGTLDVNMPLPFDLDIPQLQQHLSNVNQTAASVTTCVKTDIIDISAPLISAALTTTTTTTAVATTTSGNTAITNTLSSNTMAQQKTVSVAQQQQVVQSNNPAAHSVIKKTLQQQQQLMDVNQQMVQLKQVVEYKRQQQQQQQQQLYRELSAVAAAQEAAADREALANLIQQQQQQQVGEYLRQQQQQQQQQFVQTELTYVPRAPSPITEEDYSLLRHAKEIVENRAEEFNRYSQIIEKSEYDRLAETVKKVEKRMRDIEKQTISCRKQLADEHERNYREEQKLNKLNKQLKQQLDQANEKVEKLNAQLRERRAEIKKMEKKLKVEGQTSAENVELNSRLEQIERDLAAARQKHSEEKQRLAEENQKLTEIKKSLQQELSCATNEIERLHSQLEDKTAILRKSEANYKQERHQTQVSLKDVSDRAKKAEINLLEFKLEIFTKTLLRSHDECKNHVCQLEDLLKKLIREQSSDDLKWLGTYVQDYQKVRDKIQDALQKMKIDFTQQIDLVKGGKPLASLPVLEMPKPIPYPQTPKQFYTISHEPKHPLAPIGVHPTGAPNTSGVAPSNMAAKNRSYSPGPVNSMVNGSSPSARVAQQAPSATVASQPQSANSQSNISGSGGQFKQQLNENQSSMNEISPNQYMQQQQQSSNLAASTLSNQQNLANAQQQQQKGPPTMQQQQQVSQPVQQPMRNDFTPWSDPLQGLTQSLFGNKPLVNMLDSFGTYPSSGTSMPQGLGQQGQQSASLNKNAPSSPAVHVQQVPPPQLMSAIPPPPIVLPPNAGTAPGQWHPSAAAAAAAAAGWAFGGPPPPSQQQQQMYAAASRQLHSAPPQSMEQQQSQNGPIGAQDDSMQNYGRSTSRQQVERNSPLSNTETSMDSQITSDKSKQIDAVVEQLRNVFPHLNSESIRDCVNEFRSMQYNRSLKGLTIEHLFYGVSNIIFARHKSQQNAGGWSLPPPFTLGTNPDGSANGSSASQYVAGHFEQQQQQQPLCTLCGCGMRGNDVYTLNCNHTFHNNCINPWLLKKPSCPICCAYVVPPEEFPDLA